MKIHIIELSRANPSNRFAAHVLTDDRRVVRRDDGSAVFFTAQDQDSVVALADAYIKGSRA